MSNAFALATVTFILKDLLTEALSRLPILAVGGGPTEFSTLPPSRIKIGAEEKPQLNLFLYQLAPNPGWRQADLPSRDARGARLTNAPLALDLEYMLSAYVNDDLQAEIILGHAMQALHEMPVLTRERIVNTLQSVGAATSPAVQALGDSDLAQQIELVKITPRPLGGEEMSKLWSSFQAQYRPSAAYHASVVLIERHEPAHAPLPVLTIGRPINSGNGLSDRMAGVTVSTGLVPLVPALTEIVSPGVAAIRLNEPFTLRGHHLDADDVRVRVSHVPTGRFYDVPPVRAAAEEIVTTLPSISTVAGDAAADPDSWQAGVYTVAVITTRAGDPPRETNALPVALAPSIASATATRSGGQVTFAVDVAPKVRQTQLVTAMVDAREYPVAPPTGASTQTVTFICPGVEVPPGTHVVRLRVDHVDSLVVDRGGDVPRFDPLAQVVVP